MGVVPVVLGLLLGTLSLAAGSCSRGGYELPILKFPILLEERGCVSSRSRLEARYNSPAKAPVPPSVKESPNALGKTKEPVKSAAGVVQKHASVDVKKQIDPVKLTAVNEPLKDSDESTNCPTKPWVNRQRPMWYSGGALPAGTETGPDIIYSQKMDPSLRKSVSMAIFEYLARNEGGDSTCLCYHDAPGKEQEEESLKCLCKARGLGQMLDQALPSYLMQQAIVRGEYPHDVAVSDAESLLHSYRAELQKLSDATHNGISSRPSHSGKVAKFEEYPGNIAQFLNYARDGKVNQRTGELQTALDLVHYPGADCTSDVMKSAETSVPVPIETQKDEVLDLATQMKRGIGLYNPDLQKIMKQETYDSNPPLPPTRPSREPDLQMSLPEVDDLSQPPAKNRTNRSEVPATPPVLESGIGEKNADKAPKPIKILPRLAHGPDAKNAGELGDCCNVQHNKTRGCSAKVIQDCVCRHDSYCCEAHWDQTCVRNIDKYKCSFRIRPYGHVGDWGPSCRGVENMAETGDPDEDSHMSTNGTSNENTDTIEDMKARRKPQQAAMWCVDTTTGKRFPCNFFHQQDAAKANEIKKKARLEAMDRLNALSVKRGNGKIDFQAPRPVLKAKYPSKNENGTTVIHQPTAIKAVNQEPAKSEHAEHYGLLVEQNDLNTTARTAYIVNDGLDPAMRASLPSGPPGPNGDCCTPHEALGCSVPSISDCVCAIDDSCCTGAWDATCVAQATKMHCTATPCKK